MKEVIRVPQDKRARSVKRGTSVAPGRRNAGARLKSEMDLEEEGVDELTDQNGVVWSWEGDCETTRSRLLSFA